MASDITILCKHMKNLTLEVRKPNKDRNYFNKLKLNKKIVQNI